MALSLQSSEDDVGKSLEQNNVAPRRGRMILETTEDSQWVARRLKQRVSYTGWFFAMMAGLWLWTLMIRAIL